MGGSGGDTNQSIDNTFNMSTLSQNIFEQVSKTATSTTASGTNIQDLTLNIMNLDGCTVSTGQKITAKTMSSSTFDSSSTANIKNVITNDLQAAATSALERNTEMGSELGQLLGGDTNQDISSEVNMQIENLVKNTITEETLNSTVAEQVNIQGTVLNIGNCTDSDIKVDQDIVADVAATSITNMVRNVFLGGWYRRNIGFDLCWCRRCHRYIATGCHGCVCCVCVLRLCTRDRSGRHVHVPRWSKHG